MESTQGIQIKSIAAYFGCVSSLMISQGIWFMAKSKKLQKKVIRNRIGLTKYPRVYAISKSLFSRYIKTLKVGKFLWQKYLPQTYKQEWISETASSRGKNCPQDYNIGRISETHHRAGVGLLKNRFKKPKTCRKREKFAKWTETHCL
jgi:hypothetical protein